MDTQDIVFVNVNVFDGTGAAPFPGELCVHNDRIAVLARGGEREPRNGARVIDGEGAALMPGLTEGHAHLTWPNSIETYVPGMSLPVEELTLTAARNARILLDHFFTSASCGCGDGAVATLATWSSGCDTSATHLPRHCTLPRALGVS